MRASPTNNRKTERRSSGGSNRNGTSLSLMYVDDWREEECEKESARIVAAAEKVNVEPAGAYRNFVDTAEKSHSG